MATKLHIEPEQISEAVQKIAHLYQNLIKDGTIKVYGVPRGGCVPSAILATHDRFKEVTDPKEADLIIDDLLDSGRTRDKYMDRFPQTPFEVLFVKESADLWYVFPWEIDDESDVVDDLGVRVLQYMGVEVPDQDEANKEFMQVLDSFNKGDFNLSMDDWFQKYLNFQV